MNWFKNKSKRKKKLIILLILNTICIVSLSMIVLVYGRVMYFEVKYAVNSIFDDEIKNSKKYYEGLPHNVAAGQDILLNTVVKIQKPVDSKFSVVIPKLGINEKVLPHININDEKQVEKALEEGIGWAEGTVEPGSEGNSLLFSHSTQNAWDIFKYNAQFTLLGKMENNDFFSVVYEGRQYDFMVFEKQVVPASDTSYLTAAAKGKVVTLQTCWPAGSNKSRLLIRGRLVAMESK